MGSPVRRLLNRITAVGILHHDQAAVADLLGGTQVDESPYLRLDITHCS